MINNPWALVEELVYANVLLADGRPDQALPFLKTCEVSARSYGAGGWVIQSFSLQSLCYQETQDFESALESLRGALELAEPEGYVRTFVDQGPPMQHLLQLAVAHGIATDYVPRLLAAFPVEQGEKVWAEPRKTAIQQPLVEPLTERETNILRLMGAGLSHHEIASELYLSINTIKWHTTHIYGKLGVHRRAHAVSRARELGIL